MIRRVRQQAVSCLTDLPDDMFQGSGQVFHTLGMLSCRREICLVVHQA
jgi:hypothetical protein